jgi:hypothetical protein
MVGAPSPDSGASGSEVCLEELEDIIGRNFKQPEEGLGC